MMFHKIAAKANYAKRKKEAARIVYVDQRSDRIYIQSCSSTCGFNFYACVMERLDVFVIYINFACFDHVNFEVVHGTREEALEELRMVLDEVGLIVFGEIE